ncbi:uncharacterized protein B0T15DRAFT_504680 [Chaetomium strumarium]|uniref:Rhodopsin domain-containing protein n=1 Tax=Chaetomium strumarium TaxID=1170767 RepID=A0AAJ0GP11_9PEZI|nr:hypothetical protein B0T15DRAFT_504680 [Chaetomium strumarium]
MSGEGVDQFATYFAHLHPMDNTESNASRIVASMSGLAAMSLAFMTLRLSCKKHYGKIIGWDDYILVCSWIFLAAYVALSIASTNYGVGRHLETLGPDELTASGRLLYVGEFFAIIAVAVSKTSFVVTLFRFANERWHRILLWSVLATVNLVMWSCAALLLAQCQPAEKLWNSAVDGRCLPPRFYIFYSVFAGAWSAAMDLVLAIFPWFLLLPMRGIKWVEKIGVGIAMSLGVFAATTGVVKTIMLRRVPPHSDFTYISADLLIWAAAECAVIISAASIPFYRSIFKSIRERTCPSRGDDASGFEMDLQVVRPGEGSLGVQSSRDITGNAARDSGFTISTGTRSNEIISNTVGNHVPQHKVNKGEDRPY